MRKVFVVSPQNHWRLSPTRNRPQPVNRTQMGVRPPGNTTRRSGVTASMAGALNSVRHVDVGILPRLPYYQRRARINRFPALLVPGVDAVSGRPRRGGRRARHRNLHATIQMPQGWRIDKGLA
jgi:hypothetical protein